MVSWGDPLTAYKRKKNLCISSCVEISTLFSISYFVSPSLRSRVPGHRPSREMYSWNCPWSTIVFKIRWGAQVTPLSYCGQPVISRLQSTSAPLDNSFLVTERLFSSQVSIYDIWILHIDALPSYKNGKLTEWEICRYWVLVCVFSAMSMWPVF